MLGPSLYASYGGTRLVRLSGFSVDSLLGIDFYARALKSNKSPAHEGTVMFSKGSLETALRGLKKANSYTVLQMKCEGNARLYIYEGIHGKVLVTAFVDGLRVSCEVPKKDLIDFFKSVRELPTVC